jgi:hypothetical protein
MAATIRLTNPLLELAEISPDRSDVCLHCRHVCFGRDALIDGIKDFGGDAFGFLPVNIGIGQGVCQ